MNANFNKFKETTQILWILGSKAFWIIIIILLLELLFGGILFYKYVFLTTQQNIEVVSSSYKFKENFYQDIVLSWQQREQNFQKFYQNEHINPF